MSDRSSSSDESDESFAEFLESFNDELCSIRPYMFEPEMEVSSEADDSEAPGERNSENNDQPHDRLQNTSW